MSQTSETQHTEAPAPWAQKPRDRRALSAYRHGLTGQIILLTDADRVAYEKHCQGYHQSFAPRGPVEIDLVQAVANDRWRLNHAACLESSIFADGITQPDEVTSGNAEVDTALAQGRVWISKGGNLQLLGLYESRIQRRFEKNMAEIRILQVGSQDLPGTTPRRGRPALPTRGKQRGRGRSVAIRHAHPI